MSWCAGVDLGQVRRHWESARPVLEVDEALCRPARLLAPAVLAPPRDDRRRLSIGALKVDSFCHTVRRCRRHGLLVCRPGDIMPGAFPRPALVTYKLAQVAGKGAAGQGTATTAVGSSGTGGMFGATCT